MCKVFNLLSKNDKPVFILNKNLITFPKEMFEIIFNNGLVPIVIDDNSTFESTLDWYNEIKDYVFITDEKISNKSQLFWHLDLLRSIPCNYFSITDSDLDIKQLPSDWFDVFSEKLQTSNLPIRKVAASILLDDLISSNDVTSIIDSKEEIIEREKIYWINKFDNQSYFAATDTTLAVYSKKTEHHNFLNALRMMPPYSVRHYPWYLSFNDLSYEIKNYIRTASKETGSSTFANKALTKAKKAGLDWALIDLNIKI